MRFTHFPPMWTAIALATAIYVNFFAHHWLPDMRILLLSGFLLAVLFIWFAENLGVFARDQNMFSIKIRHHDSFFCVRTAFLSMDILP